MTLTETLGMMLASPLMQRALVVAVLVAWTARRLARAHGLDEKQCELAGILHDWAQAAIVAGVVLGFFAVAFRPSTPVLLLRPFQWYGKVSYSLYIGHLIPSTIAMHLLIPLVGRWAAMGITFVVVTLIAWGLHRLGEDYLSQRFKTVLKGWQKTVTAR